jgi:hypothetical protein
MTNNKGRMTPYFITTVASSIPQFIIIQIQTQADNPALLEGLEAWLALGLLSDEQIKQLSQQYLSQPLPQLSVTESSPIQPQPSVISVSPHRNGFTQLWQSFKAEFSVRWLLFLGLFMVVVSSGVLAASQWERFPALGQYGVLFAYTLGFFTASFWVNRSNQLPLTSQTLRWVTLLLIPLNFWAMHGLGLSQNLTTVWIIAIAAILLTGIVILFHSFQNRSNLLPTLNLLILSYLHLGWNLPGFPLIAVYLGILSSTFVSLFRPSRNTNHTFLSYLLPFTFLLIRANSVSQVPLENLALAMGIAGWLLYNHSSQLWQFIAYIILAISWGIAIESQPWQAFGISLLSIYVIIKSLHYFWRRVDVFLLFLVGLQTFVLTWRLIPATGQEVLLRTATQFTKTQDLPNLLISLSWFPYVILWAVITEWLRQNSKLKLAQFSEKINFGLGCFLALFSLYNPILRSLNLLASTITLLVVTSRRSDVAKIYITHLTILITVISWINWIFPNLNIQNWAIIFLILMMGEWCLYRWKLNEISSNSISQAILKTSAYFGLGFAGISYVLFLGQFDGINLATQFSSWGLFWLVTPLTLTLLAYSYQRRDSSHHHLIHITPVTPLFQATDWSTISCILLQFLTVGLPRLRLISLGVCSLLLFLNSRIKPSLMQAILTIGFILASILIFLWEGIPNIFTLSLTNIGLILAVILISLWIINHYILTHPTRLTPSYSTATHYWANLICGVELIGLTIYSAGVYNQLLPQFIIILIATFLTLMAIIYRGWAIIQEETSTEGIKIFRLPPLLIYCFTLVLELLVVQILNIASLSTTALAITNLLIGLITQGLGYYLKRREAATDLPSPWYVIPLVLATVSLIILLNTNEMLGYAFTSITIIFYLTLAKSNQQIRLTYFALVIANILVFRELLSTEIDQDLLWWVTPVALSGLYIAQVDLSLKHPQQRQNRHIIRCIATGLICGTALFTHQWTGIIPGIFSLIAIFAGLGLRVRAFLYVGTVTFLINACNQLIILNLTYSFLKWVIGFLVGLFFIWIAANFETRREQVFSLLQEQSTEFEQWE